MRRRFIYFTLPVASLFLVLLWLSLPSFLVRIPETLIHHTPVERTQLAIVISGGFGDRIRTAADLYHKGVTPKLLMSGETLFRTSMPALMADYAVQLGVDRDDIMLEVGSSSTYLNAARTLPIVQKMGLTQVIVITSSYHSNRTFQTFQHVFKGSGIQVDVYTDPDDLDYSTWWRDPEMIQRILQEQAKRLWYRVYYGI